jgi:hypothetical protein
MNYLLTIWSHLSLSWHCIPASSVLKDTTIAYPLLCITRLKAYWNNLPHLNKDWGKTSWDAAFSASYFLFSLIPFMTNYSDQPPCPPTSTHFLSSHAFLKFCHLGFTLTAIWETVPSLCQMQWPILNLMLLNIITRINLTLLAFHSS